MFSLIASKKELSPSAFKERLRVMICNMEEEVESLQIAAEDPLVLDRAYILNMFNAQIKQEVYVFEHRVTQKVQGLGTLLALPRELRDMIYGHAITNGTLALARASGQTRREISPLLFKKGIYRLAAHTYDDRRFPEITRFLARKIQNLEIRVDLRDRDIPSLVGLVMKVDEFDDATVQRQTCTVVFAYDPQCEHWGVHHLIRSLAKLTGFERVVLELELHWYRGPSCSAFLNDHPVNALYREYEGSEPTLGPAEITNTGEKYFLEPRQDIYRYTFYPRKNADKSTGRTMIGMNAVGTIESQPCVFQD